MAGNLLVIGGVTFAASEIADLVAIGCRRTNRSRKQIGGGTTAAGQKPDFVEIEWHGALRGATSKSRVQSLEALAQSGAQVPIICCGHRGHVRLEQFEADVGRSAAVLYRLRCNVRAGSTQSAGSDVVGALISASRAQKALADLVRALARQAAHDPSVGPSKPKTEDEQ